MIDDGAPIKQRRFDPCREREALGAPSGRGGGVDTVEPGERGSGQAALR